MEGCVELIFTHFVVEVKIDGNTTYIKCCEDLKKILYEQRAFSLGKGCFLIIAAYSSWYVYNVSKMIQTLLEYLLANDFLLNINKVLVRVDTFSGRNVALEINKLIGLCVNTETLSVTNMSGTSINIDFKQYKQLSDFETNQLQCMRDFCETLHSTATLCITHASLGEDDINTLIKWTRSNDKMKKVFFIDVAFAHGAISKLKDDIKSEGPSKNRTKIKECYFKECSTDGHHITDILGDRNYAFKIAGLMEIIQKNTNLPVLPPQVIQKIIHGLL